MSEKRNISGIEPHKFQKGKTGNPNGRPKKLPELSDLYRSAISEDDLKALLAKARQMGKRGQMRAIEWLFEINYGKPKQNVGFTDKDGNDIIPITFVLDEKYKGETDQSDAGIST